MPYFGEQQQQQQPQQQQWGQPQQQQWGQPEQQQWGQPQQQQWGQPQQKPQQPQQQMAHLGNNRLGSQVGGQQQSFSPVQQDIGVTPGIAGEMPPPSTVPWASGPQQGPLGPGAPIPGTGGGPPGMPGVSPDLQKFLDGLSNRYQPQPDMGNNPLLQMLMMMLMGGGGGGMPPGPGMPGPGFPQPGDGPDQGEPPKPKTRGVPESWGSPPQVPEGEFSVSADIPGFGLFNGPVTIFNWIRQNIAEHGPMDEPGPEPGPEQGPEPVPDGGQQPDMLEKFLGGGLPDWDGGGFQDWLDQNPGGLQTGGDVSAHSPSDWPGGK